MTNPQPEAAIFLLMTTTSIRRPALAFLSLLLPWSTLRSEEPALNELLRDALYTEEVSRDTEKAAKQYEELLARHDAQKTFAAAALFRLAEVRRKQDRKDDAIQLYQRLIAEFPNAETETKLAKENLAALGGKLPAVEAAVPDAEAAELARLEGLVETAPDILLDPNTMFQAAHRGWPSVVKFLLANGGPSDAEDALRAAARNGNLEIVKLLTDAQAEIPDPVAAEAIWAAIDTERIKVLEYLLEKGFKPGLVKSNYGNLPNFIQAVLAGRLRGAEILLKHGVDINTMVDAKPGPDYSPCGTALHFAIHENNFDAAKWLLEKGAKPDLPNPTYGLSPLHHAIGSGHPEAIEMAEALLVAGADPNRRSKDVSLKDQSLREYLMNSTPLEMAVSSRHANLELTKLLLKHGANPNLEGSKIGKALADAMDQDIARASELVKIFADAGVPMTDPVLMRIAAKDNMEATMILLDAGAKPDENWINEGFEGASYPIRRLLIERFTIPSLANNSGIVLLIDKTDSMQIIRTNKPADDAQAPSLAKWILDSEGKIERFPTSEHLKYHWAVWRRNASGDMVKQDIDFNAPQELPALEWGNVVTCLVEFPGSFGYGFRNGFPRELLRTVRKRVSFPITFEIESKSREIIVRGDRIFFDPTKPEVPLANLQQVVEFLTMPTLHSETLPIIHVSRKGWPDIRLSYGSKEAGKFELKADDHVMVEIPDQLNEYRAQARRELVMLKVEGYPFVKFFRGTSDGEPVAARIPTLIQAIVDTQVPLNSNWMEMGGSQTVNVAELSENEVFQRFSLLSHLDLANIRIRRLMEDGAEKVIEVNLAKVIAAANVQTTAEEAKKADFILTPGDAVEIPILKDRLGEPWKGFSAQEEAFFAKALSGRVQVTDDEGNITVRDLLYKAPRFIESQSGWIPMPPESGIATIRGSWLISFGQINVKRGDTQSGDQQAYGIFLRNGDEIQSRAPQPRRGLPPQPMPQPRRQIVVPPSPPSR